MIISIYIYTHSTYTHTYMYISLCTFLSLYMYIHIHIYIYIYVYKIYTAIVVHIYRDYDVFFWIAYCSACFPIHVLVPDTYVQTHIYKSSFLQNVIQLYYLQVDTNIGKYSNFNSMCVCIYIYICIYIMRG